MASEVHHFLLHLLRVESLLGVDALRRPREREKRRERFLWQMGFDAELLL